MAPFLDWFRRQFEDPQVVVLAVLLLLGMLAVAFAGGLLAPVLASLIIAYLLEAMVKQLRPLVDTRSIRVTAVFILFMLTLLAALFGLVPMLSRQATQLFSELPNMLSQGQQLLLSLPERYPSLFTEAQVMQLSDRLRDEITGLGQALVTRSLASVVDVIAVIVYLVLMPVLVFFFLYDKDRIQSWFISFMPKDIGLARQVWEDMDQQMGNYVRGKVWEIIIVWAATSITFSLLGLKYAVLLGFVTGISVLIPYIGAAVVTLPVAAVAWFQFGFTLDMGWVVLAYLVIQALDGNMLVPLLFSEVVKLHPVAIIVAVLFFGGVWGFWGVFFAIPLATLIKSVIDAWPTLEQITGLRAELPAPGEGEAVRD